MVVSKNQFTQLGTEVVEYLTKVEPFIDQRLTANSEGFLEGTTRDVGCTVTLKELQEASETSSEPTRIILGQIRLMYERAGWDVSINTDHPDGGFIKFQ